MGRAGFNIKEASSVFLGVLNLFSCLHCRSQATVELHCMLPLEHAKAHGFKSRPVLKHPVFGASGLLALYDASSMLDFLCFGHNISCFVHCCLGFSTKSELVVSAVHSGMSIFLSVPIRKVRAYQLLKGNSTKTNNQAGNSHKCSLTLKLVLSHLVVECSPFSVLYFAVH